jgi:hypothetical protein
MEWTVFLKCFVASLDNRETDSTRHAALTTSQRVGNTGTTLFTTGTQLATTGSPLVTTGLTSLHWLPLSSQVGKFRIPLLENPWKNTWGNVLYVDEILVTTGIPLEHTRAGVRVRPMGPAV